RRPLQLQLPMGRSDASPQRCPRRAGADRFRRSPQRTVRVRSNTMWSAAGAGRRARRFFDDRSGIGAVEFALVAPLIIMLILATTELGQYTLKSQSLGMAAGRVGDLVTREEGLSRERVLEYAEAINQTIVR